MQVLYRSKIATLMQNIHKLNSDNFKKKKKSKCNCGRPNFTTPQH